MKLSLSHVVNKLFGIALAMLFSTMSILNLNAQSSALKRAHVNIPLNQGQAKTVGEKLSIPNGLRDELNIVIDDNLEKGKNVVSILDSSGKVIKQLQTSILDKADILGTITGFLTDTLGLNLADVPGSLDNLVQAHTEELAKLMDLQRPIAYLEVKDSVYVRLAQGGFPIKAKTDLVEVEFVNGFIRSIKATVTFEEHLLSRKANIILQELKSNPKPSTEQFNKALEFLGINQYAFQEYWDEKSSKDQSLKNDLFIADKRRAGQELVKTRYKIRYLESFLVEKTEVPSKVSSYSFSNNYSIGVSSFNDIKNLSTHTLFSSLNRTLPSGERSSLRNDNYSLNLGELIEDVRPVLYENQLDLSPDNGVYRFNEKALTKPLTEEPFKNLFEYYVFTDFLGLTGQTINGPLQVELGRSFNGITRRCGGLGYLNKMRIELILKQLNTDVASPIRTIASDGFDLSSLTQPDEFVSAANSGNAKRSTSAVEADLYTNTQAKVDFDFITYENQSLKSEYYLQFNMAFGRLNYLPNVGFDSSKTVNVDEKLISTTNTFSIGGTVATQLYAKEHFNIRTEYSLLATKLLNDLGSSSENLVLTRSKNSSQSLSSGEFATIHKLRVAAILKIGDDKISEVVARYSLTWSANVSNESYSRFELGFRRPLRLKTVSDTYKKEVLKF